MQNSSAIIPGNGVGVPEPRKSFLRRISLSQWIVISMVVGILLGAIFPEAQRASHGALGAFS